MAIREYIGARYVPRFRGTYNNTTIYEALDVVDNGQGTSYIAKIPTPANTPLTNTTYWAIYGAASGAIVNLQGQIDDMKDGTIQGSLQNQINGNDGDITAIETTLNNALLPELNGKKMCIYGDSLVTVPTNYIQYVEAWTPGLEVTNRGVAGTTITQELSHITSATDLTNFDIVLIAFGTNSWAQNEDLATMLGSYRTAFNYISTYAPNARIIATTPFYSYFPNITPRNTKNLSLFDYCSAIKRVCSNFGVAVIDFYTTSGCNSNNYSDLLLDDNQYHAYVHESDFFARRLAKIFMNASYQNIEDNTHILLTEGNLDQGVILTSVNGDFYLDTYKLPSITWLNTVVLPDYAKPTWNVYAPAYDSNAALATVEINAQGAIHVNTTGSGTGAKFNGIHWFNPNAR